VFDRPDLKAASGRFYEDALWLLGSEGLRSFEALAPQPPAAASRALPASGYWVLRSGWSSTADYACVDCGEQAAGMRTDAVPNSMHGHADCLSLVAFLGGQRVLVDSGLYSYNAGGEWESHFRETAAHTTIKVDGRDQARHIGKMAWSHSYRAAAEDWHSARRLRPRRRRRTPSPHGLAPAGRLAGRSRRALGRRGAHLRGQLPVRSRDAA